MSTTVPIHALTRFAREGLVAGGADAEQAASVAEVLVWADTIGRPNQGVWRLPILSKRLQSGLFECPCQPIIETKAPGLTTIDGNNGMGHHVGRLAMDTAIELARTTGIAAALVRNSNFLGAAGYYAQLASEHGMVGVAMSNSFPKVASHGGTRPVLGTNPMAFAAPLRDGTSVIVDLATAASSGSKITKTAELGDALPEGVAVDRDGKPITDPSRVSEGALLPFGGAKGYAIAVMVEILSGVATGAGVAHGVRSMYRDFERGGDNGHFFAAIDIARLMPLNAFYDRMETLIAALRHDDGVLLPGEIRWRERQRALLAGTVDLDDKTTEALDALARSLGVELPW